MDNKNKETNQINDSSKLSETEKLLDEVERCEDIEDIRKLLKLHSEFYTDWKKYINDLVDYYGGHRYDKFGEKCGIHKTTIKNWCENGAVPREREKFIQIGMSLKMDESKINYLLQRYGKYPKLYPKNIGDAIYLFAIQNHKDYKYAKNLYKTFESQFKKIELKRDNIQKNNQKTNLYYQTAKIRQNLRSLHFEEELIAFIESHIEMFSAVYEGLINFIDNYLIANTIDYVNYVGDDSLNSFLKTKIKEKRLVSKFANMVSDLRKHWIIPVKTDLIAFGMHLNMSLHDLNLMLMMAGMEALCARDKVESVVIYALNSIFLNNPDIELSQKQILERFTADREIKANCQKFIYEYFRNRYDTEFLDEDITDYVKHQLESIDLTEADRLLDLL